MSFGLAQAINDPTQQANIHASDVTNKFASEINPSSYYINHNTDRNYYLIGSSPNAIVPGNSRIGAHQPETNGTASIVNTYYNTYNIYNGTEIQQSRLNQTNMTESNSSAKNNAATKKDSQSAAPTDNIRKDLGITIDGKIDGKEVSSTEKVNQRSVSDHHPEDDISDNRKGMKDFETKSI